MFEFRDCKANFWFIRNIRMNTSDIQTQVLINMDDAWHNTLVLNDAVMFVPTQYDFGTPVGQIRIWNMFFGRMRAKQECSQYSSHLGEWEGAGSQGVWISTKG